MTEMDVDCLSAGLGYGTGFDEAIRHGHQRSAFHRHRCRVALLPGDRGWAYSKRSKKGSMKLPTCRSRSTMIRDGASRTSHPAEKRNK